jgi:hypothetical protein
LSADKLLRGGYGQQVQLLVQVLPDITDIFRNEFEGMTLRKVSLGELLSTRTRMLSHLQQKLMPSEKEMILRFLRSEDSWNVSGFAGIEDLPALLWKAQNMGKMASEKRAKSIHKLEGLFAGLGRRA